eukprot:1154534-Pelagomonas_calceolata.AAC.5
MPAGHDEHDTHGGSIHNNALFHANGHPAMGNISSGASSPQHPFPGLPPHQHPPPPYQHHHWQPMSPHAMQQKVCARGSALCVVLAPCVVLDPCACGAPCCASDKCSAGGTPAVLS